MNRPDPTWHCLALLMIGAATLAAQPASTPPGRLTATIDGIRIEYSPGQEAYLRPLATQVATWDREYARRQAEVAKSSVPPLPLSARDLQENRTALLHQIAAAVGLGAPPPLEAHCYDAMLEYYARSATIAITVADIARRVVAPHKLSLWKRSELVRRLQAGESIPGFTYDAKTQKVGFSWSQNADSKSVVSPAEEAAARRQFERLKLDHAFNYQTDPHGIAHLSATFHYNLRNPSTPGTAPALDEEIRKTVQHLRDVAARASPPAWPVVLSKKTAGKTPDEIADGLARQLREIAASLGRSRQYRDPSLAMVVLHEATEAAIVEHYIGSADRRWLCDGTANYVAWKIARDRAGPDFARQVYDLDAQLARYAKYQKKINLRTWPAVERQGEADRDTPLNQAHYAFATRAVVLLVKANGEPALPRLFREIGRTPREKVSMKTVAQAYRKITGQRLDALLEAAERDPIPPLRADRGRRPPGQDAGR